MNRKQVMSLALSGLAALLVVYENSLETGGPLLPTDPKPYVVAALVFLLGTAIPRLQEPPAAKPLDGALDLTQDRHAP